MMINALNSGAKVFMADFEDANSPTWDNVIAGQVNLQDAVRGTIELVTAGQDLPAGRRDRHPGRPAPGLAPAREALPVDGEPVSASLFDFGLYVFHNGRESLLARLRPVLLPARSWRATSRPASGTTSCSRPRTPSAWTGARSGPPC